MNINKNNCSRNYGKNNDRNNSSRSYNNSNKEGKIATCLE